MAMKIWKGALASLGLLMSVGGSSAWSQGAAPGQEDLANATYHGLEGAGGPVTLMDGEWQGEPWVEGGVSVPAAGLIGDLLAQADLNHDGRTESFNLVWFSGGGTGRFLYLAASRFEGEDIDVFATSPVSDRPMIRAMRAEKGVIALDLVQAGPQDGACCPGDVVTRQWRLKEDVLEELPTMEAPQRLSSAILAGVEWQLVRWSHDEAVDSDVTMTLAWSDGKFTGHSSCNRYFADVTDSEGPPGSLKVSGVGFTRVACIDAAHSATEARFLAVLEMVNRMVFIAGELVLYWGEGTEFGALYFKPVTVAGE